MPVYDERVFNNISGKLRGLFSSSTIFKPSAIPDGEFILIIESDSVNMNEFKVFESHVEDEGYYLSKIQVYQPDVKITKNTLQEPVGKANRRVIFEIDMAIIRIFISKMRTEENKW